MKTVVTLLLLLCSSNVFASDTKFRDQILEQVIHHASRDIGYADQHYDISSYFPFRYRLTSVRVLDQSWKSSAWDDYNRAICTLLTSRGCMTIEGELDYFYDANKTFGDLAQYIADKCDHRIVSPTGGAYDDEEYLP